MEYALSAAQADEVLRALSRDFTVCAPKRFPKAGRYSDTDIVRYDRVEKFSDIVWETKSDYPATVSYTHLDVYKRQLPLGAGELSPH